VGAVLVWVGACSDPPGDMADGSTRAPHPEASDAAGDPLLARARASVVDGRIAPEVAAEITSSEAPVHARARRILAVMDAVEEPEGPASDDVGGDDVPAIVAPPPGAGDLDVPPIPTSADEPRTAAGAATREEEPAPVAASTRGRGERGTLTRMALSGRGKGATLTLFASGGVLVGVANQRDSKIVRLVVETDRATNEVLAARPRMDGVRVTNVRRASGSVFVTLELQEGWSLGKIERFSGGARVRLTGPG